MNVTRQNASKHHFETPSPQENLIESRYQEHPLRQSNFIFLTPMFGSGTYFANFLLTTKYTYHSHLLQKPCLVLKV